MACDQILKKLMEVRSKFLEKFQFAIEIMTNQGDSDEMVTGTNTGNNPWSLVVTGIMVKKLQQL